MIAIQAYIRGKGFNILLTLNSEKKYTTVRVNERIDSEEARVHN